MGLDICVRKPVKLERLDKNNDDYTVLEASEDYYDGLREAFSDFILESELEFYDSEAALIREGKEPELYNCISMSFGETTEFIFEHNSTGERLTIRDIPLVTKRVAVLPYKEVGYQRKGANQEFYANGMWDSPPVLTLKELQEHDKAYFQEGYEHGKNFKVNIIDNHVDGETYVVYC